MKAIKIIIVIMLVTSCGNNNTEGDFRNAMDRYKNEELPKQDVTVSNFEVDTIADTKFISEIKSRLRYGKKSILIITRYYLKDSLVDEITNGPFEDSYFEGQIMTQGDNNYILHYLIKDKNDKLTIFQLKPGENQLEISKVDSSTTSWDTLKSEIIDKAN